VGKTDLFLLNHSQKFIAA